MSTEPILFKPSGTIQISNPFNFGERMLLNTLMYHAQSNDIPTASEQSIPLDTVFDSLGWGESKNEPELKKYGRKLLSTIVEWNEFGVDRRKAWKACQFVSEFAIRNGHLHYRINAAIIAEIKRPELYGKIHMLVQTHLKKKHSQVLYEYFQDEIGRSTDDVAVIEKVEISDITKMLGIEESEYYNQYKHLNGEILKPCTKEINKHSDVTVIYSAVRKGRNTIGVKFTLKRSDAYQLALDLKQTRQDKNHGETLADKLQGKLEYHGMASSVALRIVTKYSAERVQNNITYLENEINVKHKTIKNKGAWLRKAIEEDWQPVASEAEIEASEKLQESAKELIKKKQKQLRIEELEKEFEQFREQAVHNYFDNKSKSFQTRRKNDFIKRMQDANQTLVLDKYAIDGFNSPIVRGTFFSSLYDELLTQEHETSIDAYAMWKKTVAAA